MLAKYIAMTPLDKTLKRALNIKGRDYVISLSPDSLKITEKGHRIGLDLLWAEIVSGETALAVALHASLGKFQDVAKGIATETKDTSSLGARAKAPIKIHRTTKKRASRR
jgi:hypothetical protein